MQALGLVTLRSKIYIQETVFLRLVEAVQAVGRLMNSPTIASSLLLDAFLFAPTFLPLIWGHRISPWFSYQSSSAISLCIHGDVMSFLFLSENSTHLGFAQVDDFSVTPVELCLSHLQLLKLLVDEGACRPWAVGVCQLWCAAGRRKPLHPL